MKKIIFILLILTSCHKSTTTTPQPVCKTCYQRIEYAPQPYNSTKTIRYDTLQICSPALDTVKDFYQSALWHNDSMAGLVNNHDYVTLVYSSCH